MASSTPSSSSGNMVCLPEEPELVGFGEDHEGLPLPTSSTPQMTSLFEGYVTLKKPPGANNGNYTQNNTQQKSILPDVSAHFSASPSPPTMTASSASSAISSNTSSAIKCKLPEGTLHKL